MPSDHDHKHHAPDCLVVKGAAPRDTVKPMVGPSEEESAADLISVPSVSGRAAAVVAGRMRPITSSTPLFLTLNVLRI